MTSICVQIKWQCAAPLHRNVMAADRRLLLCKQGPAHVPHRIGNGGLDYIL